MLSNIICTHYNKFPSYESKVLTPVGKQMKGIITQSHMHVCTLINHIRIPENPIGETCGHYNLDSLCCYGQTCTSMALKKYLLTSYVTIVLYETTVNDLQKQQKKISCVISTNIPKCDRHYLVILGLIN